MARRQRTSKPPTERPTYRMILDQAVIALEQDGFDLFNVQRVLDNAEVSRATLYRHFPDVDTLIEAALVENFRSVVDLYIGIATNLVESSPDLPGFRDAVRTFLTNFSAIPANVRLQRTHTIALSSTRPALATSIGAAQEALTDGWAAAFDLAQQRGLMRADLDTRAAAVMIQAIALGRIVDDAAATHLGNERWAQSFFEFIDRTMLNSET
jgi:AcrR family transcriptional regulator